MDLSYLITALLILFGMFAFSRMLNKNFSLFFEDFKDLFKKTEDVDLDKLIEREKSRLRRGELKKEVEYRPPEKKDISKSPHLSKTESYILGLMQDISKDTQLYGELKSMLKMLDDSKWGAGKHFSQLADEMKSIYAIQCDALEVSAAFVSCEKNELFIKDKVFSLTKTKNLVKAYIWMKYWSDRCFPFDKTTFKAEYMDLSGEIEQAKALEMLLFEELGNQPNTLFKRLISEKYQCERMKDIKTQQQKELILSLISKFDIDQLIDLLNIKAKLLRQLRALDTSKKDLTWALEIFELNKDASNDEIKKVYRSLAKKYHPDTLRDKDYPDFVEKRAQENFNLLQEAYNLINNYKKGTSSNQ